MEAAWTISETCRFRIMTPAQYAQYVQEPPENKASSTNRKSFFLLFGV